MLPIYRYEPKSWAAFPASAACQPVAQENPTSGKICPSRGAGLEGLDVVQGHPEEVYAAKFLQGGAGDRMMTASAWSPFIWDLETCQQVAEGPPIPAPELPDRGEKQIPKEEAIQPGALVVQRESEFSTNLLLGKGQWVASPAA